MKVGAKRMKAFQVRDYKSPLELVEVPVPAVGANDVLVQVVAASVNQLDEMLRIGTFKATLPYKLPFTLGCDFAGEVVATGDKVTAFKVGDKVFGKASQMRIGSFAEFISIDQGDIAKAPSSISLTEAAALPLVFLTAWQALVIQGGLKTGQKVLIHGGSGGLGSIAIQLAKRLGAYVATTAGLANEQFVRELGADEAIDYRHTDFSEVLKDFDLVIDTQGGATLLKSIKVLKPGGKVIGLTGPPDRAFAVKAGLSPILQMAMALLSAKVRRAAAKLGVKYEFLFVDSSGEQMSTLTKLVDAKVIHPIIGCEFPFDQTPEALKALVAGKVGRGKAVIVMPAAGGSVHD